MEAKLEERYRILNRDIIKYIAMLTMLLNHISIIFMKPGSFLSEVFLDIGYFTAIVMCYFLVEGFRYTHSKKMYGIRLAIFALLSEVPFCLAFTRNGIIEFKGMNMLFTLFLCFLILVAIENVSNKFLKVVTVIILVLLTKNSDWALMAPIFTLLFIWANGSKNKTKAAFVFSMLLFGSCNFITAASVLSTSASILYALETVIGMVFAGVVIIYLYNGKRMEMGRNFSKWFFYLFYPVHLLILGFIRI